MKKIIIIPLIVLIAVAINLQTSSAIAGSKQRHRWEGFAIGLGTAIIGSVILDHHHNRHYYKPAPTHHRKHPPPPPRVKRHRGHWEMRKVWVPPTYKRVWNPGHYDRRGRWVEGNWIEIVDQPGYWVEERVWIAGRH
jgi:hypothetical protein